MFRRNRPSLSAADKYALAVAADRRADLRRQGQYDIHTRATIQTTGYGFGVTYHCLARGGRVHESSYTVTGTAPR